MPHLELRTFGTFQAEIDGTARHIASRKGRALLGILATSAGMATARSRLQLLLWGDRAEDQSRASLRQELAALRRALGPGEAYLWADAETVSLDPELTSADAARLLADTPCDPPAIGAFLEGLEVRSPPFESWLRDMRRSLSARICDMARHSGQRAIAAADWAAAERLARRILDEDSYDGSGVRMLMTALAAQGRRAAALSIHAEHKAMLSGELEIPVDAETDRLRDRLAADATPDAPLPAAAPPREVLARPAVLFLPFEALGSAEEDTTLAAGLCEDIRTTLAYWRWFPVIGPEAVSQLGDLRAKARAVQAAYVVTGSVRRSGARVRVTARLIDARSARELWGQSYDGNMDDLFTFQEEISRRIVSQVEPEILRAAEARISRQRPSDMSAWDLIIQAANIDLLETSPYGTPDSNARQQALLRQALERDPNASEAWARLARCHWRTALMGWAEDRVAALDLSLDASRRALEIDPNDWLAHALRGITLVFGRREFTGARAHARQAVALNPSSPLAHYSVGCVDVFDARHLPALDSYETVFRLNPNFSGAIAVRCDMMMCHALQGDHAQAVPLARMVIARAPAYLRGLQRCAAVLAHAGEVAEAQQVLQQSRAILADFSEDYIRETYPFRRAQDIDYLLTGLRKAGWNG